MAGPWIIAAQIGLAVGSHYLRKWLSDPLPDDRAKELTNLPTTEEGAPVPWVMGIARVRQPAIAWNGGTVYQTMSELFDQDGITVHPDDEAVRWYGSNLLFAVSLPMGPVAETVSTLRAIYIGDRRIQLTSTTSSLGLAHGEMCHLFPGVESSSSAGSVANDVNLYGRVAFFDGRETQQISNQTASTPNVLGEHSDADPDLTQIARFMRIAGIDPTTIPDYRGLMLVSLTGYRSLDDGVLFNHPAFFFGPGASAPPISFEVLSTWDEYIFIATAGDPAAAIKAVLTSPWGGLNIDPTRVDATTFQAAATTLAAEGNTWSRAIEAHTPGRQVIQEIVDQIAGVCYQDPYDGKFKLTLLRGDYDPDTIPHFGAGNVLSGGVESYRLDGWPDLINQVRARFTDQTANYAPREAVAFNTAHAVMSDAATDLAQPSGKVRFAPVSYLGCTRHVIASGLAARDLQLLSQPLSTLRFRLNRLVDLTGNHSATDLRPGSVFKLTLPSHHISGGIFRVTKVEPGQLAANGILVDAIEDAFASTAAGNPDPVFEEILPFLLPIHERYLTEAPYWIQNKQFEFGVTSSPTPQRLLAVPVETDGAYATSSVSRSTNETLGETVESADVAGGDRLKMFASVSVAYPRTAEPYDITTGLVIDDAHANLAAVLNTYVGAADESLARLQTGHRLGLLIHEDGTHEWISFAAVTGSGPYTLSKVWRGLFDTAAIDHPIGTRFVYVSDSYLTIAGTRAWTVGDTANVTMYPVGGILTGSGDDPVDSVTVEGRAAMPPPCAHFGITGPQLTGTEGDPANTYLKAVSSLDGDFRFLANRRLRTKATITRGDAGSESEEAGTTFEVIAEKQHPDEDPDAEVTIVSGLTATLSGSYLLGKAGHGEIDVKLRSKNAGLSSWTDPTVRVTAPSYRNLLANGAGTDSFGNATLNGWTAVTGTAQVSAGTSSLSRSATGRYFTSATNVAGVTTFEQIVDVSGYRAKGMAALLDFYYRNLAADADDTVTMSIEPLDAASASLAAATSSGALVGSTTLWTRALVSISALPADTAKLRVTVTMTGVTETDPSTAVAEMQLRLGQVGAQLLANPTFDAAAGSLALSVDGSEPHNVDDIMTVVASSVVAGAAMTALSMTVTLTWSGGGTRDVAPTDGALDGWTSGTWTTSGADAWVNTYTRASQAVGTTCPTFTVDVGATPGTITLAIDGSSAEVASPSETGDTVTIDAAPTLAITIDGTPEPVETGDDVALAIAVVVGGSAQTDLVMTVDLEWSNTGTPEPDAPVDTDLDGWTNDTGWDAVMDGEIFVGYTATFTKATHTVSTSNLTITIDSGLFEGDLTIDASVESAEVATVNATQDVVAIESGITWSVDASSGIAVPADATEWGDLATAESLSAEPVHLHLCQEASGNLADSIGSFTLTASGSPTYQNAITGWTRKGLGIDDGTFDGFISNSGNPNPGTTSWAVLAYVRLDSVAAETNVVCISDSVNNYVLVHATAAGKLKPYIDTAGTEGASVYEGGSVFPLLLVYDRTNSRARVYTDVEKISPAYGAGTAAGFSSIGHSQVAAGAGAKHLYTAWFSGADAEWLSTDANAKALLQALGWSVSGY